ncbi:Gfo/Idh/MocA family oxidoreductase [Streptomyces sp. PTM05]|uniref:Gfo/Idh/MocA family oxidoreductase n=1 Tax=Streptantibioticus parmotrematis TaxID=2873249 RepID=A0ABS7QTC3_9ACTN|nr:Gfo/Idh/MocA family oxidoreductase [Streptantibioticus parmotrematis]MBY8886435.1 Gfo/Idh/MocA family oxidoreductase [Streptantibioticus parmotrematis]
MPELIDDGPGNGTPRPVRIGVLGCADIARRRMLPAFAAASGAELAAVASRDGAKSRETASRYGCAAVTGYPALLERDDVEAVYVPLPVALHAEWVEAALRAGKHVLAEKPLTGDPAVTRKLLRLAAERGLVLAENVMFVHHAQHAAVRKMVADGEIGALRSFSASFAIPELPPGDIRYRRDLGGGALLDVGLYPVRAALHLLGPGLRLLGAGLYAEPGREVETSGAALLTTPGGDVMAQLSFGIGYAYRSAYELWGSEGRIRVERAFTPPADHHPVLLVERPSGTTPVVLEPDDQAVATVTAFTRAVRDPEHGSPDAAACAEQAELLAAIQAYAARTPHEAAARR